MDKFDIDNVLQISELSSELDFERASALQLKLRWMVKEDESLKPIRDHLRLLIRKYETKNWSDIEAISAEQIDQNEKAWRLVSSENKFFKNLQLFYSFEMFDIQSRNWNIMR
jgi:hypothetical protein